MLEVRFLHAPVATATQPKGSYPLGDRALNARSDAIFLPKCGVLLTCSGLLERFMVFFDAYSDRATLGFGTLGFHQTPLAIFHRELDLNDLIVIAIYCWCPAQTLTARRTCGFLRLPVNWETAGVKALLCFGLPLVIGSGGRD